MTDAARLLHAYLVQGDAVSCPGVSVVNEPNTARDVHIKHLDALVRATAHTQVWRHQSSGAIIIRKYRWLLYTCTCICIERLVRAAGFKQRETNINDIIPRMSTAHQKNNSSQAK